MHEQEAVQGRPNSIYGTDTDCFAGNGPADSEVSVQCKVLVVKVVVVRLKVKNDCVSN